MHNLKCFLALGIFFVLCCAATGEELAFPPVIIEGRELIRIRPGESVMAAYDRGRKIRMPERMRREKRGRYFLFEGGVGSEDTATFGCLGRYRRDRFAVDVEADFMSTEGTRDYDDARVFNQKTSFYIGTDEGPSFRVELRCAERFFDLPGPDWNPFVGIERESAFKSVAAALSGGVLSETSLDIEVEAGKSVIDDNNDNSDVYTAAAVEARGRYGKAGFGCSFRRHDLDGTYTADEVRVFASLSRIELGSSVTADIAFHIQDYGGNGAHVDPKIRILADLYEGIVWETVLSREMVVKSFDESYGANDYTKVNRLELKPERNWRLETSLSKAFADRVEIKLYGFGEDWKYPAVWDLVQGQVAARGFYTLRQIEGYTVLGGGLRAELKVGKGARIFLDTVLRDRERNNSAPGVIPFIPRVESEFGAEFRTGRFTLLVDAAYRGEQYYNLESRNTMEETVGLGGTLEYATGNVTIFLEGKNLAKEDYLKVQGYPSAEASWILGMRIFF